MQSNSYTYSSLLGLGFFFIGAILVKVLPNDLIEKLNKHGHVFAELWLQLLRLSHHVVSEEVHLVLVQEVVIVRTV
jgi:hypothetical protein